MRSRAQTVRTHVFGLAIALAFAGPPARAAEPPDARAFVTGLYAAYAHRDPDYLGRDAPRVFAPGLLRLIRRDAALAHGEVGALDGDPICDCQDPGGLKLVDLDLAPRDAAHTLAHARLRFPGERDVRRITLDLVRLPAGWRVEDVATPDTPSLAAHLRKHAGGK